MPGEVSLAHRGVLFLDELPEFHRNVLEVLRQPLEDGSVTISRAAASLTFPCQFILVGAMNPCPCGYFGAPKRECRCTPLQIRNYRNKISGPLLDRIDIHIEVPSVSYHKLSSLSAGQPSGKIRGRISTARNIQHNRFKGLPSTSSTGSPQAGSGRRRKVHCNATMRSKDMSKFCQLKEDAQSLLKMAISELNFSAPPSSRHPHERRDRDYGGQAAPMTEF